MGENAQDSGPFVVWRKRRQPLGDFALENRARIDVLEKSKMPRWQILGAAFAGGALSGAAPFAFALLRGLLGL